MTETLAPRDEQDIIEIVAAAVAGDAPLEIAGLATKRALGRPVEASRQVAMSAISGVTMYEPAELVMTARAGTPMREIVNLLDQQGQELAFEPMDYSRLYNSGVAADPMAGTIGGLIAVNASGPRRIKAGAARDHLLGFRAVSGRAELFKSGGRVMKNVTGYDLSKLLTGSYGTLGIMSEVTFKVLPKAETEETLLLAGLDDAAGVAALCEASGLPHEVSSFVHLPAGAATTATAAMAGRAITAMRLEGPAVSVAKRRDDLVAHFSALVSGAGGAFETFAEPVSKAFWLELREAAPIAGLEAQIWRISTSPAQGAVLVGAVAAGATNLIRHYYDWAGGLIWLAVQAAPDAHAPAIRAALEPFGGHATLIRAGDDIRAGVPVFQPQPKALAALSARVKTSFDPGGVLNPGRLRADI